MSAPIIGITTYGRTEKKVPSEADDQFFTVPTAYVDAVRRAGAVPVLLPPGEQNIEGWLDTVDGIVFAGGADIDPTYYSGDVEHPKLGSKDTERDETEFALLRAVLGRKDKPVLLICRGLQVLNVLSGGTLYEHIADVHPENIHQGTETIWTLQAADIIEESKLFNVVDRDVVKTMSGHHQGVKDIGEGLSASATAADGIVEALEVADHPFCIAVQWHPEMTADVDESQQNIFDALVKAAKPIS
ncbi:gamma-glutamyl-gamma-aminobutyrate hydrolase family protein [Amylibacter sp. SFDW26]|uniref:gamma-glutamyl-gamma-aminobutyrate hydrolase family protein n=1 Tax=Amylibacter sp. SFDW26 TaxID=2652722 RepID=UPI001261B1BE|nr:gamma-glutamyl-gamma-aminobutyrate hydrolase family protein [Amylibacter sp. SFDW26]KAB7614476.1 gamma-glutamyl-gamma-aminobutyrate hydrolase family protein [Amylibacter sp. SFDW26]